MDKVNREKAYKVYVLEHMHNVSKAYYQYGLAILKVMNNESMDEELHRLVNIHDRSKLNFGEFDGYRGHFFPTPDEDKESTKADMDKAWLHHMNNNKHHPEYWILRDADGVRPLDMERVYIAEMILDWIAMGYKFNTSALQWFRNKGEYYKEIMSPNTFHIVEKVLTTIFPEEGK